MEHIYGVPALSDDDQISAIAAWSRALARAFAARDAAIVAGTGKIPEGDPDALESLALRVALLETETADTGWISIPTLPGFEPQPNYAPQCRRIGHIIYLRGGWSSIGVSADASHYVGTLPEGFRPGNGIYNVGGANAARSVPLFVFQTDGSISLRTAPNTSSYYLMDGLSYPID